MFWFNCFELTLETVHGIKIVEKIIWLKDRNNIDLAIRKYRYNFGLEFITINITNRTDFQKFNFSLCKKTVFKLDFIQHHRDVNYQWHLHVPYIEIDQEFGQDALLNFRIEIWRIFKLQHEIIKFIIYLILILKSLNKYYIIKKF